LSFAARLVKVVCRLEPTVPTTVMIATENAGSDQTLFDRGRPGFIGEKILERVHDAPVVLASGWSHSLSGRAHCRAENRFPPRINPGQVSRNAHQGSTRNAAIRRALPRFLVNRKPP
jgi:hypothetical protein